jgi:hypothetical protein
MFLQVCFSMAYMKFNNSNLNNNLVILILYIKIIKKNKEYNQSYSHL